MKKNYFTITLFSCFLILCSITSKAQNINFTIDTAVDTGTNITETIVIGIDTYVLTIDHQQNVEELDNLGGGDLIFFLGSGSASTPFVLNITRNGILTNFNLNNIDYDTLGDGTISLTNQNDDFISAPTTYLLGSGTLMITNATNAMGITQINIIPGAGDIDALNDFGFHNIDVDVLNTLSTEAFIVLDNKVKIYPNPSNGNITIKNSGIALNKVQISDLNGRIIFDEDLNGIIEDKELNLRSKLFSGMYLMTLTSNNTSIVKKLIIE